MASRTVQGQVAEVSSRPWEDQRRGTTITLHSFKLEGNNQWFRTGTDAIPAGRGQSVKFVADGVNVDMKTFEVVESSVQSAPNVGATTTPTRTTSTSPRAGAGTKDSYWEAKEARDIAKEERYQAVAEPRMALSVAVQAAADVVVAAINKDALSFGSAAKAKKLGLLTDYVKEVALDLAVFIQDAPNQIAQYKSAGRANVAEAATNVDE